MNAIRPQKYCMILEIFNMYGPWLTECTIIDRVRKQNRALQKKDEDQQVSLKRQLVGKVTEVLNYKCNVLGAYSFTYQYIDEIHSSLMFSLIGTWAF